MENEPQEPCLQDATGEGAVGTGSVPVGAVLEYLARLIILFPCSQEIHPSRFLSWRT